MGIGVGMLATLRSNLRYSHRSLPSFARTPIVPASVRFTYCLTLPALQMTTDEYPAFVPPRQRQTTSPVFLSSATIVASWPPGVQTSQSPSTSGDSVKFHDPARPRKSVVK